jgi:phosphatidylserine synthase
MFLTLVLSTNIGSLWKFNIYLLNQLQLKSHSKMPFWNYPNNLRISRTIFLATFVILVVYFNTQICTNISASLSLYHKATICVCVCVCVCVHVYERKRDREKEKQIIRNQRLTCWKEGKKFKNTSCAEILVLRN